MKLELKHLAAYLPFGLKCVVKGFNNPLLLKNIQNNKNTPRFDGKCFYEFYPEDGYWVPENLIKPILKPMAYLTNEIDIISPVPNFFNIDYLINTPLASSYEVVVKLLELHYDVFKLIDAGLAVDIIKLNFKQI